VKLAIRGGLVVDPANDINEVGDVYVEDGRLVDPAGAGKFTAELELDAAGRIVCPGLVDLSARLREPGQEHKATIASETRAAAGSGVTTLCCPPDTQPAIDTAAVVELIHQRTARAGMARVETLGALTHGLDGERLAEMGALKSAGCLGVSNAGRPIRDLGVLLRAMEYAATFDLTVFSRPSDPWLRGDGQAHAGAVATRMGLPGIPETAETVAVARDLLLAEQTGARLHFCRLSTGRALEMVRQARNQGLPITADVAAHQLHLTEEDLLGFNSECHLDPPLRSMQDRGALRAGLADGTLDAVCSDHQPHERDARLNPFAATEPGISALETLVPLTMKLVDDGVVTLPAAIAALSSRPAGILRLDRGSLSPGRPADICIIDPKGGLKLGTDTMLSRGHNSPFLHTEFAARVTETVLDGRIIFPFN